MFVYILEKNNFSDLKDKVVVVKQNDISESLANELFQDNRKIYLPQLNPAIEILKPLTAGIADFTFVEESLAEKFNNESEIRVKKYSTELIKIVYYSLKNNKELVEKLRSCLQNNYWISSNKIQSYEYVTGYEYLIEMYEASISGKKR